MVAKLKLFDKKDILKEHRKYHQAKADEFAAKLKTIVYFKYLKTLSGWGVAGTIRPNNPKEYPTYTPAFAEVNYEIYTYKYGIEIVLHAIVEDGTGQPNMLWYWLDQGTKDYTFKRDSSLFLPRIAQRTSGKQLQQGGGGTRDRAKFSDTAIRIHAGQTRKGIEPRNWTSRIVLETLMDAKDIMRKDNEITWKIKSDFKIPK